MMISHLGGRGYSILKASLPAAGVNLDALRRDLVATPVTPAHLQPQQNGDDRNDRNESATFPLFSEGGDYIHVPRFYGLARWGPPREDRLPQGAPVDLAFHGSLRGYQETIVDTYLRHVNGAGGGAADGAGGGGILEVPCGRGKTVIALNIVSRLRTKTIIIVHKTFLLNQWIERIEHFLPGCRLGRIQGPVFDVQDKDIVIAMLQTVHSRDFPEDAFASFGLTVVDEVHRIGSQQFSRALQKIVTRHALGMSATVERKDGLTEQVLYSFLGDLIYSETRSAEIFRVRVQGLAFVDAADAAYARVDKDRRGEVKYTSLISKLCGHAPRTDFVVRALLDLRGQDARRQIMVLSHQRAHLADIRARLATQGCGDDVVGFYLGGMKQEDLKASEGKKVILATYAMAAEALDIKSLSGLVLATPRTDVRQSVGRILRDNKAVDGCDKVILDIIDQHEPLRRQWYKRKRFYLEQKFCVKHA
jgi:superfamily II DNA or RNA helicase